MKTTLSLLLASAALGSAQLKTNPDNSLSCTKPDAAYCAGDSLGTDIIVRCTGTAGTAGRCSNNLAGQPPLGSANGGRCWQSSPTAGDAACEKNCVVYAATGSFTLPASVCKPTYTATSSAAPTSTITFIHSVQPTTTSALVNPSLSTSKPAGTTTKTYIHSAPGGEECTSSVVGGGGSTVVSSFVTVAPTKTAGGGGAGGGTGGKPPVITAGAAVNAVGGVMGVVAVVGGLLL